MFLTRDEEAMLAGEKGEGIRTAMELLVALGDIYEAKRLVPIKLPRIFPVYPTRQSGREGSASFNLWPRTLRCGCLRR